MKHGPVDLMVMEAGEPRFEGTVLEELERLSDAGTIRVLDALILVKREDGEVAVLAIENLPEEQAAALAFIGPDTRGLLDSEDANTLVEDMTPGSAIIALAIEQTWAIGLVNALADAGVEMALTWRMPAPAVDEALAALEDRPEAA